MSDQEGEFIEDISECLQKMCQNIGIQNQFSIDKDLESEHFYIEIYKILFPQFKDQIIRIEESSDSTSQKIQQLIKILSQQVLHMDLSHIVGELITNGDQKHKLNFIQILQELSKLYPWELQEEDSNPRTISNYSLNNEDQDPDVPKGGWDMQMYHNEDVDDGGQDNNYADQIQKQKILQQIQQQAFEDPVNDNFYQMDHDRVQNPQSKNPNRDDKSDSKAGSRKNQIELNTRTQPISCDSQASDRKNTSSRASEQNFNAPGSGIVGGIQDQFQKPIMANPSNTQTPVATTKKFLNSNNKENERRKIENEMFPKQDIRVLTNQPKKKPARPSSAVPAKSSQTPARPTSAKVGGPTNNLSNKAGATKAKPEIPKDLDLDKLQEEFNFVDEQYRKMQQELKNEGDNLKVNDSRLKMYEQLEEQRGYILQILKHFGALDDEDGGDDNDENNSELNRNNQSRFSNSTLSANKEAFPSADIDMKELVLTQKQHIQEGLKNMKNFDIPEDDEDTKGKLIKQKNGYKRYLSDYIKYHTQQLNKNESNVQLVEKNIMVQKKKLMTEEQNLQQDYQNQQQSMYYQLRDEKINYLRKIHRIIFELEKQKIIDEKKEFQKRRAERNRETRNYLESLENAYQDRIYMLKESLENQRKERHIAAVEQREIISRVERELKQEQNQMLSQIKNEWFQEKSRFQHLVRDEGQLEREIMDMYQKY